MAEKRDDRKRRRDAGSERPMRGSESERSASPRRSDSAGGQVSRSDSTHKREERPPRRDR